MRITKNLMKKTIALMLSMLLTVSLFAGCSGKSKSDGQDVFVTFNGQTLRVGDNFNDLSAKLGAEIQPSEEIKPCDPNSDEVFTLHFFDGMDITVGEDGTIDSISVRGDKALLQGKVAVGTAADEVKSVCGEPETDDGYALSYTWSGVWGNIYIDEGAVSGFMLGRSVN